MSTAPLADDADAASSVTFGYRTYAGWTLLVLGAWVVAIAVQTVAELVAGLQVPFTRWLYLVGVMLGVLNQVMVVRRVSRGLALDPEGITLYFLPLHLSWSSVSEVGIPVPDSPGAKPGVQLTVTDPRRLVAGLRGVARFTVRWTMSRHDGRIRVSGARLQVPAEEVVSAAQRFMAAPLVAPDASVPSVASGSFDRRPFLVGTAGLVLVVSSFVLQSSSNGFHAPPNSPYRLAKGNCFDRQETKVFVAPCSTPHDGEVFGVAHLGEGIAALWGGIPSAATIVGDAKSECADQFLLSLEPDMIGRKDVAEHAFLPSRHTWSEGDRTVICFLAGIQGKITGSLETDGVPDEPTPAPPRPTEAPVVYPAKLHPVVLPSPAGAEVSMSAAQSDYLAGIRSLDPLTEQITLGPSWTVQRGLAFQLVGAETSEATQLAGVDWPPSVRAPMARYIQGIIADRQNWDDAGHARSEADTLSAVKVASAQDEKLPGQAAVEAALGIG